nr:uncharacterized protein LOC127328321 [Lolium perenne]
MAPPLLCATDHAGSPPGTVCRDPYATDGRLPRPASPHLVSANRDPWSLPFVSVLLLRQRATPELLLPPVPPCCSPPARPLPSCSSADTPNPRASPLPARPTAELVLHGRSRPGAAPPSARPAPEKVLRKRDRVEVALGHGPAPASTAKVEAPPGWRSCSHPP